MGVKALTKWTEGRWQTHRCAMWYRLNWKLLTCQSKDTKNNIPCKKISGLCNIESKWCVAQRMPSLCSVIEAKGTEPRISHTYKALSSETLVNLRSCEETQQVKNADSMSGWIFANQWMQNAHWCRYPIHKKINTPFFSFTKKYSDLMGKYSSSEHFNSPSRF